MSLEKKEKIDSALLKRVAQNARIILTKDEEKEFLPQLKEVLESFSVLSELDVSKEKPSFQPIEIKNLFREDTMKTCLPVEEALSNTSHKKDSYFKGPKVI